MTYINEPNWADVYRSNCQALDHLLAERRATPNPDREREISLQIRHLRNDQAIMQGINLLLREAENQR